MAATLVYKNFYKCDTLADRSVAWADGTYCYVDDVTNNANNGYFKLVSGAFVAKSVVTDLSSPFEVVEKHAAGTFATSTAMTAINNNGIYRVILDVAGSHTAAKVAGTYALGYGDPIAVSGTGILYPIGIIAITAADYPTVNGITTKLRIKGQINCNDAAPTGNYTFGLYPITRPSVSGGAGLCIYTLGTVVAGSNGATIATPAADSINNLSGANFVIPADGLYCIGLLTTATVATSAHIHITAQLQMRNN